MKSNSNKLTGDTNDTAIEVEDAPAIRREESEEEETRFADLPSADDPDALFVSDGGPRRSKRSRTSINVESSPDSSPGLEPLPKRRKDTDDDDEPTDDKKKMAMDTSYEGFAIYGRVLCLVVKRRDRKGKGPASIAGGQAMMEDWITSTQMPQADEYG